MLVLKTKVSRSLLLSSPQVRSNYVCLSLVFDEFFMIMAERFLCRSVFFNIFRRIKMKDSNEFIIGLPKSPAKRISESEIEGY